MSFLPDDLKTKHQSIAFPQIFLWLMITTYIAFFNYLSFLNHDHFLTNGFDLGIFDYAAWNNLHGNFFPGLLLVTHLSLPSISNRFYCHLGSSI